MNTIMRRIADARLLAIFIALAVTVGGVFSFRSLPVDAFPDVTPAVVFLD